LKFKNQSERPFRQDEQQFYLFHPPMPTENGKLLQQFFDERTKLENEKYGLWEEERNLAKKFDNLSRNLMEVRRRVTSTVEEEISKNAEIRAIQNQIHKIAKEGNITVSQADFTAKLAELSQMYHIDPATMVKQLSQTPGVFNALSQQALNEKVTKFLSENNTVKLK
jgi:FKBP-type peptidyl-prolyl cis-trans isomerase (trigger factor)